ncbi:uncharacterized protein LOC130975048 [Arachis stenosperma]|uniref:uncharacterized protein LOC130975048 n=1 Tax=Arachis stenosperma TaxID=217475 RepID=UPI0025ABAEAC|nr:uncharacterized protein LOC130975048 [Arachis stenosperma]
MKQGVLTLGRVRLLLHRGTPCFRGYGRRNGERRRKSVRGCIVSPDLSVLNLYVPYLAYSALVYFHGLGHRKPPSHASPLPSISPGEDAWREEPWVRPEIAERERAAIASAAGFPSSPSWSREDAVTDASSRRERGAFFQEWTQQVQDILNTKKFGDIAFGDKDLKNAIEYYSKLVLTS